MLSWLLARSSHKAWLTNPLSNPLSLSPRLMEKENKKMRDTARREYNDVVRVSLPAAEIRVASVLVCPIERLIQGVIPVAGVVCAKARPASQGAPRLAVGSCKLSRRAREEKRGGQTGDERAGGARASI